MDDDVKRRLSVCRDRLGGAWRGYMLRQGRTRGDTLTFLGKGPVTARRRCLFGLIR